MRAVPVKGKLHVDEGCASALLRKKNLYAAGVTAVDGSFGAMDAVEVVAHGVTIARCLVNLASSVRLPCTCRAWRSFCGLARAC